MRKTARSLISAPPILAGALLALHGLFALTFRDVRVRPDLGQDRGPQDGRRT